MSKYPLKKQADDLARYGRYGDTVLVHMNPIELEGIAALTPGGLSTNPVTGQPEAFAFLIPMLASAAGSAAGLGVLGSAALSGAATAAITGDIKRGLASAVMGAGIGSALGAAGSAGAEAAAAEAASNAATAVVPEAGIGVAGTDIGLAQGIDPTAGLTDLASVPVSGAEMYSAMSPMERLSTVYGTEAGRAGLMQGIMKPSNLAMTTMGAGTLEQMQAAADAQDYGDPTKEKREEAARRNYANLQRAYGMAQPGAMRGASPYRLPYLPGPYRPPGMRSGGSTTETVNQLPDSGARGQNTLPPGLPNEFYSGRTGGRNPGYGGIDPVTIQRGLRGDAVPVPRDFMPGFNPEMRYFQDLSGDNQPVYPEYSSHTGIASMWNPSINRFAFSGGNAGQPYFASNLPNDFFTPLQSRQHFEAQFNGDPNNLITPVGGNPYGHLFGPGVGRNPNMIPTVPRPRGMAAGGTVPVPTPGGDVSLQEGGIADMAAQGAQSGPDPQELQIVAAAVLGQLPQEQADMVINEFIERHGPMLFQMIRDQVLQSQAPGAQTEGMIRGQGTGMEDQVPGTIGNQSPVAVSPGEYIVPADVVSGLGDGSSDAGAQRLDQMADGVRAMRQGGNTSQPPPIDPSQVMP